MNTLYVLLAASVAFLIILVYVGVMDENLKNEIHLTRTELAKNKIMLEELSYKLAMIEAFKLPQEESYEEEDDQNEPAEM